MDRVTDAFKSSLFYYEGFRNTRMHIFTFVNVISNRIMSVIFNKTRNQDTIVFAFR
jgi:hypothetical protein